LRIYGIIWKNEFAEKIISKHNVTTKEVEDILFSKPFIRMGEKGRVKDENVYVAYGQTETGRYLVVFFIFKRRNIALPISARDMTLPERRYYNEQKEAN